jgi:hypothetical protein
MVGITARRPRVAGAMVGALLCVAAIALPSTAGAAVPTSSSGSAVTGAIARAELSGGTLFKYHPATDTWTQISIPGRPVGVLAPELSDKADASFVSRKACLVLSVFTIGLCDNTAVTYEDVVPTKAATIIKSLETVDEDDLKQLKEGDAAYNKAMNILKGGNSTASDDATGGYSNGAAGAEDEAIDFGDGFTDVVVDVLEIAFL